ncbi:MAG TPA: hypothetical protein VM716_15205 [Gemmatimonadales bacterium]|nr:hypothetical protein [Gemmatimonadales bacterium]
MTTRVVSLSVVLLAVAGSVPAQIIPIQTAPIAPADQFDIFPSYTLAMGGVSIAVVDSLHDPFINPAKGARLRAPHLFGSPTFYGVSHDAGAGRTLPVGAFSTVGSWYGGLALALQQVDAAQQGSSSVLNPPVVRPGALQPTPADLSPGSQSHDNALAFAMVGKVLPASTLSVGGSVRWAKVRAVDGIDLLYPGSVRVDQFGETFDARLGLLKAWEGDRSLEAILLHDVFRMTYDVTFLDLFWDPGSQRFLQSARQQHDRDYTRRWGVQLKYERPLAVSSGWRIGWLATANRISQPATPNNDVLNIPQDPGHAAAYELGVGVSRTFGPAVFAVDLVYQPIWSSTWVEADARAVTSTGDTIPVGGRTVDNDFHFSNALFRMGVSREVALGPLTKTVALQLGLAVRSVHYTLEQSDHVDIAKRTLDESWLEWTPTWGLSFRFPELELRYRGQVTHGTDRLVAPSNSGVIAFDVAQPFGPTPGIPATLDAVHVVTHQVSVSFPLR